MKDYPNAYDFPELPGFFGVGIENSCSSKNIGTVWRSAQIMGASFIFVIGERYWRQKTDTTAAYQNIPLFYYSTLQAFTESVPMACKVVGVELDGRSVPVTSFTHPRRCIYLLGNERTGLSEEAKSACDSLLQLPGLLSLNVSVAASLVMYDRLMKHTFSGTVSDAGMVLNETCACMETSLPA